LSDDGRLVIATFAADGPTTCSGLPTARFSPDELADQFPDLRIVTTKREEHHNAPRPDTAVHVPLDDCRNVEPAPWSRAPKPAERTMIFYIAT
jgi:hypothetical protein